MTTLDNPVWAAIGGVQRDFGRVYGKAALYHMKASPFGGLEDTSEGALDNLAELCEPGRIVALMYRHGSLPQVPFFNTLERIEVHQMVCGREVDSVVSACTELTESHVEQMINLVRRTNPGPFGKETIRLGRYIGVMDNDSLLAMAGERFRTDHFVEVSGVCTHPEAQGRGLAAKLVANLLSTIKAGGDTAFLHVRIGSPSEQTAVKVYQRLGFQHHQTMMIDVLQKN